VPDPRFLRLSRAIALGNLPVLAVQARHLHRTVPRLPSAAAPWSGVAVPASGADGADLRPEHADDAPVRLLVLGDSTVAGVGVRDAVDGLAGRLAAEVAVRLDRRVSWRAVGRNGATARDLLRDHLAEALAAPADLLFLSVGANDAIHARSGAAFARDLRRILAAFSTANPRAPIVMSSLPRFGRFTLLREPLRTILFRHALRLEAAARRVIAEDPRRTMADGQPPYDAGFFAADGFHPGASGYRQWAVWAVDAAWSAAFARLADPRLAEHDDARRADDDGDDDGALPPDDRAPADRTPDASSGADAGLAR
jgi:lysophospholipase L1-like esterase